MARYLHLPTRGTKDDSDDVILKAIGRCDVQLVSRFAAWQLPPIRALLVIDFTDLELLDCGQREGRASNDHIKYLANHALYAGRHRHRPGGQPATVRRRRRRTRDANRRPVAHHKLAPFSVTSKHEAVEWIGVVKTLQDARVHFKHEPGSLGRRHWRYLHERSSGSIAALHNLIRLGAIRAVRTGQEAVTRNLLDGIRLDYTSERRYARLDNAKTKQGHRETPIVARDARNEVPPAVF